MKTLTLRIPEQEICTELEVLKQYFGVKSDSKTIKELIKNFRYIVEKGNRLQEQNAWLKQSLSKEQTLRKNFTLALNSYTQVQVTDNNLLSDDEEFDDIKPYNDLES